MRTDLVEKALRQAVTLRKTLPRKVIVHGDQGTQFTSTQLDEVATELKVAISMGRTGVCWDNAATESFWSIFKHEFYYRHTFATINEARTASYAWIDEFYNNTRRHSAIGMLTPSQYEQQAQQLPAQAA